MTTAGLGHMIWRIFDEEGARTALFDATRKVGYYIIGGFIDWMYAFHAGLITGTLDATKSAASHLM